MTTPTESDMIARALEMPVSLLPLAPELLADFEELGADIDTVVDCLRELGIGSGSLVVDLGCGKGAVAIAVAQELGCRVLGVELFAPFVEASRAAVQEAGLQALVTINQGSAEGPVTVQADVVLFCAMGDTLGRLDETIGKVRAWARPGGHIVIDDSVLLPGSTAAHQVFGRYGDEEQAVAWLQAHGDTVVQAHIDDDDDDTDELDGLNDGSAQELRWLESRVAGLMERHPELASDLRDFLREQSAEYASLNDDMLGAVFVVRRG